MPCIDRARTGPADCDDAVVAPWARDRVSPHHTTAPTTRRSRPAYLGHRLKTRLPQCCARALCLVACSIAVGRCARNGREVHARSVSSLPCRPPSRQPHDDWILAYRRAVRRPARGLCGRRRCSYRRRRRGLAHGSVCSPALYGVSRLRSGLGEIAVGPRASAAAEAAPSSAPPPGRRSARQLVSAPCLVDSDRLCRLELCAVSQHCARDDGKAARQRDPRLAVAMTGADRDRRVKSTISLPVIFRVFQQSPAQSPQQTGAARYALNEIPLGPPTQIGGGRSPRLLR